MIRDCIHPYRHHIWFLDILVSEISQNSHGLSIDLVNSTGRVALYRIPSIVTDILSELTPARAVYTGEWIESITKKVMVRPEVREHYKEGGVSTTVLMLRGEALKTIPRSTGKEVYYWVYRSADFDSLHVLES